MSTIIFLVVYGLFMLSLIAMCVSKYRRDKLRAEGVKGEPDRTIGPCETAYPGNMMDILRDRQHGVPRHLVNTRLEVN